MQLFGLDNYQSDTTLFLDKLKQQDPGLPKRQKEGHALLWYPQLPESTEKRMLQKGFDAARIAQQPYVYGTDTGLNQGMA